MKLIIWNRPDNEGTAEVVYPPYKDRTMRGKTPDEILAWSIEHQVGKDEAGNPQPHSIVEQADVVGFLTDRTFRHAWEVNGSSRLEVNMPKARIIHMDRIRKVRNAELAKLDVLYMKAQEKGDAAEQQQIASQKQVLRDIPQTFDLETCTTPEALTAAWPAELPRGTP